MFDYIFTCFNLKRKKKKKDSVQLYNIFTRLPQFTICNKEKIDISMQGSRSRINQIILYLHCFQQNEDSLKSKSLQHKNTCSQNFVNKYFKAMMTSQSKMWIVASRLLIKNFLRQLFSKVIINYTKSYFISFDGKLMEKTYLSSSDHILNYLTQCISAYFSP